MKLCRTWLLALLSLLTAGHVFAATYTLPADFGTAPFNGCTKGSGTTYNCGAITISNDNTINVTATLTISATSFTVGNNVTLAVSNGVTATISVTSGGAIKFGNNNVFTANLVTTEDISMGNFNTINGNVSVPGKTLKMGSDSTINGNVSASTLDFGNNTVVNGTCTPSSPKCKAPSSLNHVEIVHNGSALSCTPKAVTVLACTTAASCNGVAANQSSTAFSFAPAAISGGQWCSDSVCASPITGAVSITNGSVLYVRDPNARTDTLAATASSASTTAAQCTNTTTGASNATTACNLTFQAAGFLVNAVNHTSCTAQTITLQAVQSSATSNTCVPAFQNVNRNLQLSTSYLNPTTGTKSASLRYVTSSGGATSTLTALSTSAATPSTLSNLYFDNSGRATLSGFSYPDVGQLSLNPVYTGSAATGDNGLALSAISGNTFIAAPGSFAFGAVNSPQVAGAAVALSVTAQNACATPATAPNFGQESTPATATLTSTNPQPAQGNASAISQTLSGFASGSKTASITWLEVGTVDLVASVSNYLGSGMGATSTKSALGRFVPSYFDTKVTPACGSFSYSGQPFNTTVTAHALGGTTTANYGGATWAKAVTLSDANAGPGSFLPATMAATVFSNGTGTVNTAFTFTAAQTAPTSVVLKAVDTDAVSSNAANQAGTSIRSGRLKLLNSYGSDLLALPVPLTAQYWNGNGWVTNTADNCTSLPVPTSGNGLVFNGNLTAAKTTPSINGVSSGNGLLAGGDAGFKFSAPGRGIFGSVDITINSPTWLMYPWSGGAAVKPTAKALFGIYKSPLIYQRENH